jgi:hypothetical protein
MKRGAVVLRNRVRYSLLTLMLVSLWIATAALVWHRREPWVLIHDQTETTQRVDAWDKTIDLISPDKTRYLRDLSMGEVLRVRIIVIYDFRHLTELYHWDEFPLHDGIFHRAISFLDDNHLLAELGNFSSSAVVVLHRRHPEWWWGHFYRPEVWALIALTVFSTVFTVRSRLKRHAVVA